ncbi:hypothetical protein EYF80_012753 [Liparis tanakae]|uniref:Uncharacterized protein n=1 Tax=Liparis tanakae TaxID=230148 RepID=A0A4Z2IHE5_9TELE|nr:hypothetical protein EYF80_012753 [Liparis tanakae]
MERFWLKISSGRNRRPCTSSPAPVATHLSLAELPSTLRPSNLRVRLALSCRRSPPTHPLAHGKALRLRHSLQGKQGRGPSVPTPLRGGGAGDLSERIKGPSAEAEQACSQPRRPDDRQRPPPTGRASCLPEIPGGKYPPAVRVSLQSHPVEVRKSVESE